MCFLILSRIIDSFWVGLLNHYKILHLLNPVESFRSNNVAWNTRIIFGHTGVWSRFQSALFVAQKHSSKSTELLTLQILKQVKFEVKFSDRQISASGRNSTELNGQMNKRITGINMLPTKSTVKMQTLTNDYYSLEK